MHVRSRVIALIAIAAVTMVPTLVHAFQNTVTARREWRSGTAKMAQLSGTFRLAGGERISSVHIEHLDASGRVVSAAMGTVNRSGHTWTASSGDFRTVKYRAAFYITDARGGNLRVFYSTTYLWTGS